jgi:glycosyltransferase involved in cell wall biosynthesis
LSFERIFEKKQVIALFLLLPIVKNTMKRVLFLESGSGYGGSSKCLFLLLEHLDRSKFDPEVLYYNFGPNIDLIQRMKIKTEKYSFFKVPRSIFRSDLVYINNEIYGHFLNIFLAKIFGKRCICHVRGIRSLTRGERLLALWVGRFIAVSNICKKNLTEEGIPEKKIEVVYDGIDPFEAKNNDQSGSEVRIGVVGRISRGKGQDIFIEAAKHLTAKEKKVRFFVIGDDAQEGKSFFSHLKSLVARYGLEENVVFSGWKTGLKEIYGNLDIVVCPSVLKEALGNVIIEAMMLSKPIIASDSGAYPEMIQDNITGLLFKAGHAIELAQKIDILLKDEPFRTRLGQEANKVAKEKFNIMHTVNKTERIIYEELSDSSARS